MDFTSHAQSLIQEAGFHSVDLSDAMLFIYKSLLVTLQPCNSDSMLASNPSRTIMAAFDRNCSMIELVPSRFNDMPLEYMQE